MAITFYQADRARHVEQLDRLRPTMAKAVNKVDLGRWRVEIGKAITRTWRLAGLSQKEAAARLEKDQAQIARWESGEDRPQFDALFAAALGPHLIQALAELTDGLVIETVVRMRRDGR